MIAITKLPILTLLFAASALTQASAGGKPDISCAKLPSDQFYVITNKASGGALEVKDKFFKPGALIAGKEKANGFPNQHWRLVPTGKGNTYQILNKLSGFAMVAKGANFKADLIQAPLDLLHEYQDLDEWCFFPFTGNLYFILNPATGYAIEAGWPAELEELESDETDLQFSLKPVGSDDSTCAKLPEDQFFVITNRDDGGALEAKDKFFKPGALIAGKDTPDGFPNEHWRFVPTGRGNAYQIINKLSGFAMVAESTNERAPLIQTPLHSLDKYRDLDEWCLIPTAGVFYYILNTGTGLFIESGWPADIQHLDFDEGEMQFTLKSVGGDDSTCAALPTDKFVQFINKGKDGVLEVKDDFLKPGALIAGKEEPDGFPNENWRLVPTGKGKNGYQIINQLSGFVMVPKAAKEYADIIQVPVDSMERFVSYVDGLDSWCFFPFKGVYFIINKATGFVIEAVWPADLKDLEFDDDEQHFAIKYLDHVCPANPKLLVNDPSCRAVSSPAPTPMPTLAPSSMPIAKPCKDVTRAVLWNTDKNKFIRLLKEKDTIDLCDVGPRITIKVTNQCTSAAEPEGGRVFFKLKDRITKEEKERLTDNKFPYFLGRFGRQPSFTLAEPGKYSLSVLPTPGADKRYLIDVKACKEH